MVERAFAISMMRDEVDIARHVVTHLLEEDIDVVLVADNLSSDGTRDQLEELWREHPGRVMVVDDPDPAYYQSKKMTWLSHIAADHGATWIVPFDADEVWYAPDRLGGWLRRLGTAYGIVPAKLWNHFPSAIDPAGDNPFETIVWRQPDPGALPKVAFRYRSDVVVAQGNHAVHFAEAVPVLPRDEVRLRHFPYRSYPQFRRKAETGAAAYAATDLPQDQGAHWRQYGAILERHGDDALRQVFERWYWNLAPVEAGLVHDPAPFRRWNRGGNG